MTDQKNQDVSVGLYVTKEGKVSSLHSAYKGQFELIESDKVTSKVKVQTIEGQELVGNFDPNGKRYQKVAFTPGRGAEALSATDQDEQGVWRGDQIGLSETQALSSTPRNAVQPAESLNDTLPSPPTPSEAVSPPPDAEEGEEEEEFTPQIEGGWKERYFWTIIFFCSVVSLIAGGGLMYYILEPPETTEGEKKEDGTESEKTIEKEPESEEDKGEEEEEEKKKTDKKEKKKRKR